MATYQRKLNGSNSECITIWENGVTDTFKSFTVIGNKSDGVGSYTLIKLPSDIPTNCVINSATIRMPERNYEGYWGPSPLLIKASRLSGAWSGSPSWSAMPTHDTDVYGSELFDDPAPKAGTLGVDYDYVSGSIYILYHDVDIKDVIQRVINSGGSGLMFWYDLPGADSSRKYFTTTTTTDENMQWELTIDYTPNPQPSQPSLSAIGTVTNGTLALDWPDASDSSGVFSASQLSYEVQFAESGSDWGTTLTTAQGVSLCSLDLLTLIGLSAGQYYYHPVVLLGDINGDGAITISDYTLIRLHLGGTSILTGDQLLRADADNDGDVDDADKTKIQNVMLGLDTPIWIGPRVRIRTKTPAYGGTVYYSEWAVSNSFVIDYRLAPSAPGLTLSKAAAYEGEEITFTCTQPATFNTKKADGTDNTLQYRVELPSGTLLGSATGTVSESSKDIAYTVGNLTTEKTDLITSVRARCIDGIGQAGSYCVAASFTVQRFRAPVLNISGVKRTADDKGTIYIVVQDTGFCDVQSNAEIRKLQYQVDSGAWVDATIGAWDGLSNSFEITGMSSTRHTIGVRAVNAAPASTVLADKTGGADTATLLEYSPAFFRFIDRVTGILGIKAKSLVVSRDFAHTVPQNGDAFIEQNLDVGGNVSTDGNVGVGGDIAADGDVGVGGDITAGGQQTAASMRITGSADVTLSSTNHPFQIGPSDGGNLAADGNEISARYNGGASALYLNPDGGDVYANHASGGGKLWNAGKLQIRTGQCTLNTSSWVSVSFASALSGVPRIVFGPASATSGVLAPKHRNASASGFEAVLGGSGLSGIVVDYIAIYMA